jgi:ABC-type tungstate transport system substrate-binding protein
MRGGRPSKLREGDGAAGIPGYRRGRGDGPGLGRVRGPLIFAGSFPGVTQSIPLAIFAVRENNFDAAVALSMMVLAFAFTVILVARFLLGKAAEFED